MEMDCHVVPNKRPDEGKKGIIALSHVADMELSASREEFHRLVEFFERKKD